MAPEKNFSPLSNLMAIYRERFDETAMEQKKKVWKVICEEFLQKFISKSDIVLDLGAGTCEFINHIRCGKKYAIDVNPDTGKHADARSMSFLPPTFSSTCTAASV